MSRPVQTSSGAPSRDGLDAIVFDMDGTLIASHSVVPAVYRATVLECGGPELSDAEVIAGYPFGAPSALLAYLLDRPATAAEVELYHTHLARLADQVTVFPGIADALAEIAARVPVGLFTGASRRSAEILLGQTGLLGHFKVVLGGDQVARPKPSPDGVELACQRLGVVPDRAAYVGDSPLDLRAARDSGAMAIAAAWGHQYDPTEPADLQANHPRQLLTLLG